jgi:hypothetical protein
VFNFAADSAASDVIRLQWAYLLSLLNVGVLESTNHPRFLVFDEPQQQSVSDANFLEMLKFAAAIPRSQIIDVTGILLSPSLLRATRMPNTPGILTATIVLPNCSKLARLRS